MILEASPDSPAIIRIASVGILYLHIAAGGLGIASGAVALMIQKGSPVHKVIGNVFFVSMLIMASIGAAISPFLPEPQWPNVFAGVFVLFLVITSWTTIRRRENTIGTIDRAAFVFAMFMVASALLYGIAVALRPTPSIAGYVSAAIFATVWSLAAMAERRMIARGGVAGVQRTVRHLWRMCVALLIAVFSFFLGQAKVFPEIVRASGVLFVPPVAVVIALVYWLVRMRRGKSSPHVVAKGKIQSRIDNGKLSAIE